VSAGQQQILLVDDAREMHALVRAWLADFDVNIVSAMNGRDALARIQEHHPDLILLDVNMPDMTGFEICRAIKNDDCTRHIPVIFITGSDDQQTKLQAFDCGAEDFVAKPIVKAEFRARTRTVLRTQALISELDRRACTDLLTGLANREAFTKSLEQCRTAASACKGYHFAVLLLDLDNFKLINDSLGHSAGDQLLREVGDRLGKAVRIQSRGGHEPDHGIIARLGGDEFGVILADLSDRQSAVRIAERICANLAAPMKIGHAVAHTGVSIGVRLVCDEGADLQAIMRDCDIAMYRAKAAGRSAVVVFDQSMHQQLQRKLDLERDLAEAPANGELILVYQPIVLAESGLVAGFEALIRWRHPKNGIIAPLDFISLAEESGLIAVIDKWVLQTACRQLAAWKRRFVSARSMYVSVNLSRKNLILNEPARWVPEIISASGVSPSDVQLEITENVIMHDLPGAKEQLSSLRTHGLRLAMDDFGTGYSSLSALHELPVDVLKIDKALVATTPISRSHAAIVRAVIELAHNLGMKVIAEGVEFLEHMALIQTLNCDFAQGFLLSRALSVEAVEALLVQQPCSYAWRHIEDDAPGSLVACAR